MPDYKRMYLYLFNHYTDMIRQMQEAQLNTEEMFVEDAKKLKNLTVVQKKNPDEK